MKIRSLEEEFLRLLEPLKDSLYRHALRLCWSESQVSDAVQEAVLIAWREFAKFQSGTNFKAWVFKILVNTILRYNKRVARNREYSGVDLRTDLDQVLDREDAWASLLAEPARLTQLLDDRLAKALERLSYGERQCLLLRLLEDFSYKEIATMLEMPMGTVMSNVHRARIKLREQLASLAVERGYMGDVR